MTLQPAISLPWRVRALTAADVPGVQQVQAVCYGDEFIESREVFARRLSVAHQCSIGLVRDGDVGLHAYAVAYWSALGKVTSLQASARGIAKAALVSVQGSQGYWQRLGFQPYALNDPRQQANLATYGPDAIYMLRTAPRQTC